MKIATSKPFRTSMAWFHTWVGVGLGAVLYIVFWTGSLTIFDKEIDQWMKPELRLPSKQTISINSTMLPKITDLDVAYGSTLWIGLPKDRIPAFRLFYQDGTGARHNDYANPHSGETLDLTNSHAGGFFFDFHFTLHLPGMWGYMLVGIAAISMLALIVSGIFIHRKIIAEFFIFRPQKSIRRSTLDIHNLTSLVALPFHILFPLTGLIIFASVYLPWSLNVPYDGDAHGFVNATNGSQQQQQALANQPGLPVTDLDSIVQQAEQIWIAREGEAVSAVEWVKISNYGDANAYITVEQYFPSKRVAIGPNILSFNPQTHALVGEFNPLPLHNAMNWLEGTHWVQFDHWPLRWLYFLAGLSGCAMIGSGLLFWLQARIKQNTQETAGVSLVRAMSIGTMTGLIIASGSFLIANRLLPKELIWNGIHRHDLEAAVLLLVWVLTYVHAAIRDKAAWRDQCYAIAVVAIVAPVLNWLTTGDHLFATMTNSMWSIAGMDLVMLSMAVLALWVARSMNAPLTHATEPSPKQLNTLSTSN